MLQIILDKILLGFSLAATIGPLNIEMIKRGVSSGFWAAFNVRLGGAITNSVCLIVAYFGLGRLIKNYPNIIPIIYYLGSTILIYMGISTIISSCSITSIIKKNNNQADIGYSYKNGIVTGIILSAISPVGIMFWLTSFSASMSVNKNANLNLEDLLINFFIIIGVLLCGGLMSGLLYFGNKYINNKTLKIISILSGLLLIYFGIKYGLYGLLN